MANAVPSRLVDSVNGLIGKVKLLILKTVTFNIITPSLLEFKDQDGGLLDDVNIGIPNVENLQAEFDLHVPYIGATGDVDLGTNELTTEAIQYNTDPTIVPATGLTSWNPVSHTLDVHTGVNGTVIQSGLETLVQVFNDTGNIITNGSVVYPDGTTTLHLGEYLPNIGLAIANSHETIEKQVGVVTGTIPTNEHGFVTIVGTVRGIDTSGLSLGTVYISPTVSGGLTSVKPDFPNYPMDIGVVIEVGVAGALIMDIRANSKDTFRNFFNGIFRESHDLIVTSNGTTITGSLTESSGNVKITMVFSDGFTSLPVSPAKTIILTGGTSTNPQLNYIYILKSTKLLTVSTSGFPLTEHIKVATVFLKTAALTQLEGALINRNHVDHLQGSTDNLGYLAHIVERLRLEHAIWDSGVAGTATVTPSTVYLSNTSGAVYQLHRQSFPAYSMPSKPAYIVNDFADPYRKITNLYPLQFDAKGITMRNSSFSLVVWGVNNKSGQPSQIMINKPTGNYSKNSPQDAISDSNNYSVYTIPKAFQGIGFLISRHTFTLNPGGTTWTLENTEDLRGRFPNTTAGGGSSGGAPTTEFTALVDTPVTYTGQANKVVVVGAGETALEFTTPTKTLVGLGNVDNTSDVDKPISTLTQAELDNKVDDSQVLTNVPVGAVFTDSDTIYDDTAIKNEVVLHEGRIIILEGTILTPGSNYTKAESDILFSNKTIQITGVSLATSGWTLVGSFYEYDYANAGITASKIVDVIPDKSTIDIVQAAEVLPETLSGAGTVKFYSKNLPTATILVTINIEE